MTPSSFDLYPGHANDAASAGANRRRRMKGERSTRRRVSAGGVYRERMRRTVGPAMALASR